MTPVTKSVAFGSTWQETLETAFSFVIWVDTSALTDAKTATVVAVF